MKNNKICCIAVSISFISLTIGYSLYISPKSAETITSPPQILNTYLVTWPPVNDTPQTITGYAGKKQDYTTTVSCNTHTVKELRFHLNWTDDKATLVNRAGLDTLVLEITSPDGARYQQSARSAPRTKQGALDLVVPVNTIAPASYNLESEDLHEANQQVQYQNQDSTSQNSDYTVRIRVKVGEIRPLKRLADPGNSFALQVTPETYTAMVTESLGDSSEPLTAHIKAGPLSGYPPLTVSFNGNPDNDKRIVSYAWEFGPRSSPIVPESNYHNIRARSLPLLISLAVVFLLGLQGVKPSLASMFAMAKTASTIGTAMFCVAASAMFAQLTYSRSVRSNAQYTSSAQSPTMVLLATGNYWAKLTVTDSQGNTASDEAYITVLQYVPPDNDY